MHPFGQLLCVSGRTLFWKKILVGDDSPPYKDMNWMTCLKNSRLCPIEDIIHKVKEKNKFKCF